MNTKLRHISYCLIASLLFVACDKDRDLYPDDPTQDNEIRFQTGTSVTRGLIDNLAVGSELCLYGYHGNDNLAEGTDKELAGKTLAYRNFNGTDRWSVVNGENPITYFWEGDGTYRFFGWLAKDATGLTAPTADWVNFSDTDKKLTIDATLDKDYNQFDFLYSNVHKRILPTQSKSDPVALEMNHLFSAFSISLSNQSKKKITVKEVILKHIDKLGNATINYSDNIETGDGKVVYDITESNNSTGSFLTYGTNPGYEVAMGSVKRNIFSPEAQEKQYYMVWPQNLPVLNFATEDEEEKAEPSLFPLVLKYTVEGDNTVITKKMKIPHTNWEAGKKYNYEVLIADKIVTLNYTIQEWDYIDSDVNFKNGTVTVPSPIDWENGEDNGDGTFEKNTCIVDDASHKVFVEGIKPVEATFAFSTPVGGQWYVSLVGDVDAFEIENNLGPIDGNLHRIMIKPKILSPERDYFVKLQFVVMTANGDTHLANLVQTKGNREIYSIVLQKAN